MKTSSKPTKIYDLFEYGTHVPRYVGKTDQVSLERYKDGHVGGALKAVKGRRRRMQNWIRSVVERRGVVQVELLEIVPPGQDWEEAERRWIAYYRQMGCPLTNLTDGGEGASGAVWSQESRDKLSASKSGVPVSEETKKKLAEKARQQFQVPGAREAVAAKTREQFKKHGHPFQGKHLTPEHRANLSKHHTRPMLGKPGTMLGKKLSQEACQKKRESMILRWRLKRSWPNASCSLELTDQLLTVMRRLLVEPIGVLR